MFKIHFPQPSFWEYSLSISFVTEPIRKDELTAIDVVFPRNATGPAGFCMDTGPANAGVFAGVIKIAAELEDHWMGKPDLPDTVLPELPPYTSSGIVCPIPQSAISPVPRMPNVGTDPASASLSFCPPEFINRRKCLGHGQDHWNRRPLAQFVIHPAVSGDMFPEI